MINMIKTKKKYDADYYRGKYISVILQPKVDANLWQSVSDKKISKILMLSGFPLWTEVVDALKNLKVETINKKTTIGPLKFVFGTETGGKTKIPHYQIFIEFKYLIRTTRLKEALESYFEDRAFILVQKVYTQDYEDYCKKKTSNFEFESDYYWNKKFESNKEKYLTSIKKEEERLIILRKDLSMIKQNYFTGQKLLYMIANSEPDGRSAYWIADVIGNTGKTKFFQTIIDDPAGLYLRVSDGLERLSAKLRKKITARLEKNLGYPQFIWVNFGRTVSENALKTFADFGEQILDGMLDDNFSRLYAITSFKSDYNGKYTTKFKSINRRSTKTTNFISNL